MIVPRSFARTGWTGWSIAGSLALVGLGVAVTFDAWVDVWRIALTDAESAYLLLVPPAVAWMAWVRRERLRLCQPSGSLLGPVTVLIGWLMYRWADQTGSTLAWHGGAVLVLVGCLLAVARRDLMLRFLPPLGALLFLVPVPPDVREQLIHPLDVAMAELAWTVFQMLGIPAQRFGTNLVVNHETIGIAEACAGLRVVMALCLISYLFAFGKPLRMWVRMLILLFTPLTVAVCSLIGLIMTTWLLGHLPTDHAVLLEASRWGILVVAFVMLLGMLRVLTWASVPVRYYRLAVERTG